MKKELHPAKHVGGTISVPGDKSIAHRAALFSLVAKGPVTVKNFPGNADCQRSLEAVQKFGVRIEKSGNTIALTPPESFTFSSDDETIVDCGNSGTTARLLAGIAAGMPITVTLTGDESLQSRPMKRIIAPLSEMGAEITHNDFHLPLTIRGRKLLPFEYHLPVASAQVKSALLLAGLASSCSVTIREDKTTRDHTEIMIGTLGEGIEQRIIKPVAVVDPNDPRKKKMEMPEPFKKEVTLSSRAVIHGGEVDIPGDISTAAFFLAAAAISGGTVTVQHLGVNPTRTAFLDYLKSVGATVAIKDKQVISGEPRATVSVTGGKRKPRRIAGETTVGLIDEIPIVAVIAAFTPGTTIIRDASELRVKESDRLTAIAENLKRMGIKCGLLEDGLAIEGGNELPGADFISFGDHRIAMAFSIASLFLVGPSTIDDDSVVGISCPEFYTLLDSITK